MAFPLVFLAFSRVDYDRPCILKPFSFFREKLGTICADSLSTPWSEKNAQVV